MIARFTALVAALAVLGSAVPAAAAPATERAVLAGGCFWGMEAVFESLHGVTKVVSGFSGGSAATAHYEIISTGATKHAESVEITYDPSQISYQKLLEVYFTVAHDPTQLNRQGPDEGTQYRSTIFYTTDDQKETAEREIASLTAAKRFSLPIVTTVVPFVAFYPAEAYHQHFALHNPNDPYIVENEVPKLRMLRARYPQLVMPDSVAVQLTHQPA